MINKKGHVEHPDGMAGFTNNKSKALLNREYTCAGRSFLSYVRKSLECSGFDQPAVSLLTFYGQPCEVLDKKMLFTMINNTFCNRLIRSSISNYNQVTFFVPEAF